MLWCVAAALAARVVLVGDAGAPEVLEARRLVEGGGEGGEGGAGEVREIAAVMRAVRAEVEQGVDAVIVLGDNFYGPGLAESAPVCGGEGERGRARLREVVERYEAFYGGIAAPIYAVLGNHDIGHGLIWRWRARRACSVEAMAAVGWTPPGGIGAVEVDGGMIRLIDSNRLLRGAGEAAQAAAVEGYGKEGGWTVWAAHHAWSVASEKGRQPARLRRKIGRWEDGPDPVWPTIWVNGHAHHQEAVVHDGVLAITSGSGSKQRNDPVKRLDPPDLSLYADPRRGYTVLDIRDHRISGGAVSEAGGLSVSVTAHTWDGDSLGAECSWGPGWACVVRP